MALTQYCELDEVRAALGVNSDELSDTVLNLPIYEIGLVRELAKISESLPAAFLSVAGKVPEDRTEPEQQLFDVGRLFCVYSAANQVGASLATLMPKDITDGKASVSRFADSPYRDAMARVQALRVQYRQDLLEVYSAMVSQDRVAPTTPATVFLAAGRGYDPVTGS